jgi:hypothetical protein
MGAPTIFEKNRNQALTPCIHSGVTDSGLNLFARLAYPLFISEALCEVLKRVMPEISLIIR